MIPHGDPVILFFTEHGPSLYSFMSVQNEDENVKVF